MLLSYSLRLWFSNSVTSLFLLQLSPRYCTAWSRYFPNFTGTCLPYSRPRSSTAQLLHTTILRYEQCAVHDQQCTIYQIYYLKSYWLRNCHRILSSMKISLPDCTVWNLGPKFRLRLYFCVVLNVLIIVYWVLFKKRKSMILSPTYRTFCFVSVILKKTRLSQQFDHHKGT